MTEITLQEQLEIVDEIVDDAISNAHEICNYYDDKKELKINKALYELYKIYFNNSFDCISRNIANLYLCNEISKIQKDKIISLNKFYYWVSIFKDI